MKIEGHLNIIEQEARSLRARLKNMVEVVRCMDCKYWNGEYCCDFMTTYKNAFCYWGERREEDRLVMPPADGSTIKVDGERRYDGEVH